VATKETGPLWRARRVSVHNGYIVVHALCLSTRDSSAGAWRKRCSEHDTTDSTTLRPSTRGSIMSAHIKGRGYGTPSNEGAAFMSVIGVQPLAPTYGILRESAISNPHVTILSHLGGVHWSW
jgi:hypothetical protein